MLKDGNNTVFLMCLFAQLNEPRGIKFFEEQEVVTGFLPVMYVLIWRKCLWDCMSWVYLGNALGSKIRLDGG